MNCDETIKYGNISLPFKLNRSVFFYKIIIIHCIFTVGDQLIQFFTENQLRILILFQPDSCGNGKSKLAIRHYKVHNML